MALVKKSIARLKKEQNLSKCSQQPAHYSTKFEHKFFDILDDSQNAPLTVATKSAVDAPRIFKRRWRHLRIWKSKIVSQNNFFIELKSPEKISCPYWWCSIDGDIK